MCMGQKEKDVHGPGGKGRAWTKREGCAWARRKRMCMGQEEKGVHGPGGEDVHRPERQGEHGPGGRATAAH